MAALPCGEGGFFLALRGSLRHIARLSSGRSAVWLARFLGVEEVAGSSPAGPTIIFQSRTPVFRRRRPVSHPSPVPSPLGLQKGSSLLGMEL